MVKRKESMKIISRFLVLAMLLTMIPSNVFAAPLNNTADQNNEIPEVTEGSLSETGKARSGEEGTGETTTEPGGEGETTPPETEEPQYECACELIYAIDTSKIETGYTDLTWTLDISDIGVTVYRDSWWCGKHHVDKDGASSSELKKLNEHPVELSDIDNFSIVASTEYSTALDIVDNLDGTYSITFINTGTEEDPQYGGYLGLIASGDYTLEDGSVINNPGYGGVDVLYYNGSPEVRFINYDETTGVTTLYVNPLGAHEIDIVVPSDFGVTFRDGVDNIILKHVTSADGKNLDLPDNQSGDSDNEKIDPNIIDVEGLKDVTKPNAVDNCEYTPNRVKANDLDKTADYVRLSWGGTNESGQYIPIADVMQYTAVKGINTDNGNEGSEATAYVTSAVQVELEFSSPNADPSLDSDIYKVHTSEANELFIKASDLLWDTTIAYKLTDVFGNESETKVVTIPNNLIYSSVANRDNSLIEEGKSGNFEVIPNDTHDNLYFTPKLADVYMDGTSGGTVKIVNDEDKQYINFSSNDGTYGDMYITYIYEKVREDIPALTGKLLIDVEMRNQKPVPKEDTKAVTQDIETEQGLQFEIPFDMLTANDSPSVTNRPGEVNQELKIVDIRNMVGGDVTIKNDTLLINPDADFFGDLSFEYQIQDDGILNDSGEQRTVPAQTSDEWAKVTVYIKEMPEPIEAKDSLVEMRLSQTSIGVEPDISDPDGSGYSIDPSSLKVTMNGVELAYTIATAGITYVNNTETGRSEARITFNVVDDTYFQLNDEIDIEYTAYYRDVRTSAVVTIKMISGIEPGSREGILYVHRKPIAAFAPDITLVNGRNYIGDIRIKSESSYDLDHQADTYNDTTFGNTPSGIAQARVAYLDGIRAWEWSVKLLDGNWVTRVFDTKNYGNVATSARQAGINWIEQQAQRLIGEGTSATIVLSLRVRDIDGPNDVGVWSDPVSVTATSAPLPPIALFKVDKDSYIAGGPSNFYVDITDMSYDANGDEIVRWDWELFGPDGNSLGSWVAYNNVNSLTNVETNITNRIRSMVNTSYAPEDPVFKISLKVTEQNPPGMESDVYSVSFNVYKYNNPPVVNPSYPGGSQVGSLSSSTLYIQDNGVDGVVGDNYGTSSNTAKPGVINFSTLLTITDDQSTSGLKIKWTFQAQKVKTRAAFVDSSTRLIYDKTYSAVGYRQAPFSGTVTANAMPPGAYKVSAVITDNPTGSEYGPNAGQSVYWNTYSNMRPYHLYIVPKLDIFRYSEFDGYIFDVDGNFNPEDNGGQTPDLDNILPTIGDTITIHSTTNEYVENLELWIDGNYSNGNLSGGRKIGTFTKTSISASGEVKWLGYYEVQDEDIEDLIPNADGFVFLTVYLKGTTTWGSDGAGNPSRTKIVPLKLQILPVKIYDFRITDISDPNRRYEFLSNMSIYNRVKLDNGLSPNGALVNFLVVNERYTGNLQNTTVPEYLSKGYSFYFKLCSKGLKEKTDSIRIIPKLYGNNGGNWEPLNGYLPNENGTYELYLSTTKSVDTNFANGYPIYYSSGELTQTNMIGTHTELNILGSCNSEIISGQNTSEQTWSGRYGIPADARFSFKDTGLTKLNEYKGVVLITFELQACKDGNAKYNYVEKGQWQLEMNAAEPYGTALAKLSSIKGANAGAIILYDSAASIKDDYIVKPIWSD